MTKVVRATLVGLWLVAAFVFDRTPMFAGEPGTMPKKFNTYIGGFMGASYGVELHDGAVVYTVSGRGHSKPTKRTIIPSATQWREFRQALDAIKLWKWRTNYPSHDVADGTQWSIDIVYQDRALRAHGDNNFPDDAGTGTGSPETTKAFNKFLSAVETLLGGQTFQ